MKKQFNMENLSKREAPMVLQIIGDGEESEIYLRIAYGDDFYLNSLNEKTLRGLTKYLIKVLKIKNPPKVTSSRRGKRK